MCGEIGYGLMYGRRGDTNCGWWMSEHAVDTADRTCVYRGSEKWHPSMMLHLYLISKIFIHIYA